VSFSIPNTAHIAIVADSLLSGFSDPRDALYKNGGFCFRAQGRYGVHPSVSRPYSPSSGSLAAPSAFPTFTVNALAGRAITDVSPAIMSFVDAGATHVMLQLGVNDAAAGTSNGTLTTAINKIQADLVTGGITSFLWIGPFCDGEHWPSGAGSGNVCDVAIDRIDTLLAGLIAGYGAGYDYVSWRNIFNVYEPLRNPGNLFQGIFTGDGLHPSYLDQNGAMILVDSIFSKIIMT
jgi:hypothetical protein